MRQSWFMLRFYFENVFNYGPILILIVYCRYMSESHTEKGGGPLGDSGASSVTEGKSQFYK